jgi:hypothetical protein
MADINLKSVTKEMLSAIKDVAPDHFKDVRELAEDELEDFAKRTAILTKKVAEGKISKKQAKAILRIRKNAVETVLLSIAGISLLAAQDSMNAAIRVLRKTVDSAIPGISIL